MSSVVIAGNTSGSVTLSAPDVAGTTVLNLPATNGTLVTTASGQALTSPTITGTATLNGVNMTPYTMKNRIINGGMQIWQRGTSFANPANITYTADRWFSYFGTTNRTLSQQAGFSGFQYCTRLQRTNGVTDTSSSGFGQIIEANNLYALQGQTVTLSFYARAGSNFSSSGSNLSVNVTSGTTADQGASTWYSPGWAGATSPYNNSITITTTATQYSITFTVPANCLELFIGFQYAATGTAGTNDYFEITGVQLEKGSVASDFEWRPYTTELQLCQRYFYMYADRRTTSYAISLGLGAYYSTTQIYVPVSFPVTMRTNPSVYSSSGTSYFKCYRTNGSNDFSSLTVDTYGYNAYMLYNNTQASGTAGTSGLVLAQDANAYIGFNAEL